MFIKNFDSWNKYKKILECKEDVLLDKETKKYLFHTREIWYCSIGINIRNEISGHNIHFERPVLIIKKMGRKFICYPMTSKKPKNDLFYHDVSYKSKEEIVESYVLVNNPLTLDIARLQRKIRKLSSLTFNKIIKKGLYFIEK